MKTSKKTIMAICAILFVSQITFAQSSVYDVKTQQKISKIEESERKDIEKARLEISKARDKAIENAGKKRTEADLAKERAKALRADLDSITRSIQTKSHDEVLSLTSQPYQAGEQIKEIKDREKRIAAINKEAIKSIEKITKDTEKAEKDAEKAESNALKAQQEIPESVRKAEEDADKKIMKIKSKSRNNIAKLQAASY